MSDVAAPAQAERVDAGLRTALLCGGLALAVALRAQVSSGDGSSLAGGAVFAAAALALSLLSGWRAGASWRPGHVSAGLAGAAALCAWPAVARLAGGAHPALVGLPGGRAAFVGYALGTLVVVTGEEVLLRGALWQACTHALPGAAGEWVALTLGAIAFALIHVPSYGWGILPLDLAAGLWLGALRLATGGIAAPWTAHAGADLATWCLL